MTQPAPKKCDNAFSAPDLSLLSAEELETMQEAAAMIRECQRVLYNGRKNIVSELLRFTDSFLEWTHIPDKDVHDRVSYSQYYYHAHAKSKDNSGPHDDEHGHFHTFLRGKGMPEDKKPLTLPDFKSDTDIKNIVTHIVGIAMDPMGNPIKLFTTNRWVTNETWFRAEDVIAMLDLYEIDHAYPSWPVNLWVTAMMKLFKPQIIDLLHERDRTVESWIADHPGENVYEDRKLEVTSQCHINLDAQIQTVEDLYGKL